MPYIRDVAKVSPRFQSLALSGQGLKFMLLMLVVSRGP